MSTKTLEDLDKEDREFFKEFHEPVSAGKVTPERILGFQLPKTRVYVPELRCPLPLPSVYSLLPLYDSVIFPIDAKASEGKKIRDVEDFRSTHGLSPEEIATLARRGRVFPRFLTALSKYDAKLITPLLEPGVPRISSVQADLVRFYNLCNVVQNDCKKCAKSRKEINRDFRKLPYQSCVDCLGPLYLMGYRDKLSTTKMFIPDICMASQTVVARNLNAVFQTNCPAGKKALGIMSNLPEEKTLEFIMSGLGINYVPQIPLEEYVDILDTKTTRAVRKIVGDMLRDPIAQKYKHRLNSKIYDFNQEVEELRKGKTAKFYKAVSDLVVYGGTAFVERQARNYVKLPQVGLKKGAEWLASKVLDLHSKVTGKDWTIAQLYRTRCKMEKCMGKAGGTN